MTVPLEGFSAEGLSDIDFSSIINLDYGLIFILGAVGVLGILGLVILNQKYPQRTFLICNETGGTMKWFGVRLDNGKIVSGNLVEAIMSQYNLGEQITDYNTVFFQGKGNIYLAAMVRQRLIPIKWDMMKTTMMVDGKGKEIEVPYIVPEEVNNGRKIGERFAETMRKNRTISKASEPIWANAVAVLPVLLIIVAFIVAFYLASQELTAKQTMVVNALDRVADKLVGAMGATGYTEQAGYTYNETGPT